MKRYGEDFIYCEDCVFFNRPIRPGGCSAPQNLIKKRYPNRVTRRTSDIYTQRWKEPEIMRLFGWMTSRLFNVCGVEARWFSTASDAEIKARKPILPKKNS